MHNLLITGASSGVGLSLAQYFSKTFKVLALARRKEKMDDVFKDNSNIVTYQVDLQDTESLTSNIQNILNREGDIFCVVNNAGVMIKAPLDALSEDDFHTSMAVNVVAPMNILKRLLPAMRKKKFGRVINVTSGAPLNCFSGFAAYSASKAALNAITVTAARENAEYNIKINLMSPGPVRTEMAPDAQLPPEICHPTAEYLLSLKEDGPTGRFYWLGYEVPLFPNLNGVDWLNGIGGNTMRKVL